jgi:hypothetical protein
MTIRLLSCALALAFSIVAGPASAQTFFENFYQPHYLLPVSEFPSSSGGDLQATYYQIPIPALGNGELLLMGEFPRARYFSVTVYDDHGAIVGTVDDAKLAPFGGVQNPYVPGGPSGAEDILYALTVRLGTPSAPTPYAACQTPEDVKKNLLDMRSRHTATSYYSSQQQGFSAAVAGYGTVTHVDLPANSGGFVILRMYQLQAPTAASGFDLRKPVAWIRAANTGCAVQLAPAGTALAPSQWYSLNSMLKLDQVLAHNQHETDLGFTAPYGGDPQGEAPWWGREEYMPGQVPGRYLAALLPMTADQLNAQGRVVQMQLRLPQMPCSSVPCPSMTGAEQLRNWSLTFEDAAGRSLGSLSDTAIRPNADGYATLVLSFGPPLPPHVTAANGYSPVTMSAATAARAVLRNLLVAPTFGCSTSNVPPRTGEHTPSGGYMGEYAPVVTFPLASSLPVVATPIVQAGGYCQFP